MSDKEAYKQLNINFFKWRSTGVLFLGIFLMIASMYINTISSRGGEGNIGLTSSRWIIIFSMIFIFFMWIFEIEKKLDDRKIRKNRLKECMKAKKNSTVEVKNYK